MRVFRSWYFLSSHQVHSIFFSVFSICIIAFGHVAVYIDIFPRYFCQIDNQFSIESRQTTLRGLPLIANSQNVDSTFSFRHLPFSTAAQKSCFYLRCFALTLLGSRDQICEWSGYVIARAGWSARRYEG